MAWTRADQAHGAEGIGVVEDRRDPPLLLDRRQRDRGTLDDPITLVIAQSVLMLVLVVVSV
ncbi:MAG: hypothetical protein IPL45_00195 [Actinomycetales bacterium]|nr:hypothetical protein [Actinomycetales bacterium]